MPMSITVERRVVLTDKQMFSSTNFASSKANAGSTATAYTKNTIRRTGSTSGSAT